MSDTTPSDEQTPPPDPWDVVQATAIEAPPLPGLRATVREQVPVSWRETLVVLLLVVLCDLTIYRGNGFAGYAALFAATPVLLMIGSYRPRYGAFVWLVGLMMLVAAAKLLWCGSTLLVGCGFVLLLAFAMAVSGLIPYAVEVVVFASQTILAGYEGLAHYWRSLGGRSPGTRRVSWLNYVLPALTVMAFSTLFVLANPDLLASFSEQLQRFAEMLRTWIAEYAPGPLEIIFWLVVMWISVGLLRPVVARSKSDEVPDELPAAPRKAPEPEQASMYLAFRNTLITVIVLFAVYLIFEFKTLWFRVFEKGFYYSGYAHNGAAWLTVALALATLLLSLVFRGRILRDPRVHLLRTLAWLWSLENFVLAAAVYHRLWIYAGFNGMSRMRMVGIFGMSAVVVGFILVLYKIARGRNFLWLVRGHLWTLAVTVFLFAITPVDTIVVRYNVDRILAGDSAPSVQISVHPISAEGVLLLEPLLDCEDEAIREGVRAMLALRYTEAVEQEQRRELEGWTAYQISDETMLEGLRAASQRWTEYEQPPARDAALESFRNYADQWYD